MERGPYRIGPLLYRALTQPPNGRLRGTLLVAACLLSFRGHTLPADAMAVASALTELLSASAVDGALRLQLKAHPHQTLQSWGCSVPSRSVYFVEPGETPEAVNPSEAIIELPAFTGPLAAESELDLDELAAVAGGGQPYAEAVRSVRSAVRALATAGLQ